MIFGKDKASEAPVKLKPFNRLIIYFVDGSWLSWDAQDSKPSIEPWRHFYKWYFCRKQSDDYVFHSTGCNDMFKRKDIKRFRVRYGEEQP